jgi:hypothetical protein
MLQSCQSPIAMFAGKAVKKLAYPRNGFRRPGRRQYGALLRDDQCRPAHSLLQHRGFGEKT